MVDGEGCQLEGPSLLNKAVHPATSWLPDAERAAESKYYEIIGEQAVLTDSAGVVSVPRAVESGEFPTGLSGTRFEDLLAEIRQKR